MTFRGMSLYPWPRITWEIDFTHLSKNFFLNGCPADMQDYVSILNVVDYGSKYAWSWLTKDETAETVISCLETLNWFPFFMRADNGVFTSDLFKEFCNANDITLKFGRPYKPQD